MKTRFVIVGPNAGKSGTWGNRVFVNGKSPFEGTEQDLYLAARLMAKFGAYPDGTPALEHARQTLLAAEQGEKPPPAPEPEPEPVPDPGAEPEVVQFTDTKLVDALRKLDPEDDRMWTKDNLPFIAWVERYMQVGGLNRRVVSEALPGWDRDQARAERDKATE